MKKGAVFILYISFRNDMFHLVFDFMLSFSFLSSFLRFVLNNFVFFCFFLFEQKTFLLQQSLTGRVATTPEEERASRHPKG